MSVVICRMQESQDLELTLKDTCMRRRQWGYTARRLDVLLLLFTRPI